MQKCSRLFLIAGCYAFGENFVTLFLPTEILLFSPMIVIFLMPYFRKKKYFTLLTSKMKKTYVIFTIKYFSFI